jgi:hypothetical protein
MPRKLFREIAGLFDFVVDEAQYPLPKIGMSRGAFSIIEHNNFSRWPSHERPSLRGQFSVHFQFRRLTKKLEAKIGETDGRQLS